MPEDERPYWPDLPFVAGHLRRAIDQCAEDWRYCIAEAVAHKVYAARLESPLEAAFYAWWLVFDNVWGVSREFTLLPQHEVEIGGERYRIDFAVLWQEQMPVEHGPWPNVAIELDGHEFHERTKEQVAYRDRRDRALQGAGWTVLHFSGSEFNQNPYKCVEAVIGGAWGAHRAARAHKTQE